MLMKIVKEYFAPAKKVSFWLSVILLMAIWFLFFVER